MSKMLIALPVVIPVEADTAAVLPDTVEPDAAFKIVSKPVTKVEPDQIAFSKASAIRRAFCSANACSKGTPS